MRTITQELGYRDIKALERVLSGEDPLPLEDIGALARAIDAPVAGILRMALDQRWPDFLNHIERTFGAIATPEETYVLLNMWRNVTQNRDIAITPPIHEVIVKAFRELEALINSN